MKNGQNCAQCLSDTTRMITTGCEKEGGLKGALDYLVLFKKDE